MSGGSYNYAYSRIDDFRYELSRRADTPARKAFVKHLEKVVEAARCVEWVDSGDGADEEAAIMECVTPSMVIDSAIESAKECMSELGSLIDKYGKESE